MIVAQPMYPRRAALSLIYLALVYQGCIFHSALATLFSHYPTLIGDPTEWFASHPRIMRVFSNSSLSACLFAAVGHPAHLPASVRHSIFTAVSVRVSRSVCLVYGIHPALTQYQIPSRRLPDPSRYTVPDFIIFHSTCRFVWSRIGTEHTGRTTALGANGV